MAALTDQEVLDGIIEKMEAGVLPWRKPWSETTRTAVIVGSVTHAPAWPANLRAPQTPFGVFNGTILLSRAAAAGYRTNLWVASEVLKDLRATILPKDDRPTTIHRYAGLSDGYDASREKTRLVYNLDQVKDCEKRLGLTFSDRKTSAPPSRYKKSMKLLRRLETERDLRIDYHPRRAFYGPSSDIVMLPDRLQFLGSGNAGDNHDGDVNYWATLWHEVVHWTGHRSRLNRDRIKAGSDSRLRAFRLIQRPRGGQEAVVRALAPVPAPCTLDSPS